MRFSDIVTKEAKINPETSEVICPACNKSNFTKFRREKLSQKISLTHCRCENCGQLFTYKVGKKNNPVLEKEVKKNDTEHKNGI